MSGLLPVRKNDAQGNLIVSDGLIFAVFMPGPHSQMGGPAARLLDRYLSLIGSSRFTLIHDRGEQYRKLTPKKLASIMSQLREQRPSSVEFQFTLRDGQEPVVPGHSFFYSGGIEDADPLETSHVEIWFPNEYLDEVGPDAFLKQILGLAGEVPFSSGYCSLSVNYEDWAALSAQGLCRSVAQRHPGVDIHDNEITGMYLGHGVRGAYWITLLGPVPLARIGKNAAALREELGSEITVYELANGVALRAGERPLPGDINRNERLPLVRKVAAVIELVQVVRDKGILFGDREEWVKWQRRHLL